MPLRQEAIRTGDRELRRTARRFADDFRELRLRVGVTQSAVAASIGVNRSAICRLERGGEGSAWRFEPERAPPLARTFSPPAIPGASAAPLRCGPRPDHRAARWSVPPTWRATIEAPLPGPGRRSVDVRLERSTDVVLVEVETRLRRFEEIVRELHSKRAALIDSVPGRQVHVVLALPPTRHHQLLVRAHPDSFRAGFFALLRVCCRARFDRAKRRGPAMGSCGWLAPRCGCGNEPAESPRGSRARRLAGAQRTPDSPGSLSPRQQRAAEGWGAPGFSGFVAVAATAPRRKLRGR
jgi:DNA-binding XRE family transcriptional regulator